MTNIREAVRKILNTERFVILVNNGTDGYPAGRVMAIIENSPEGELWFATHSSSGKVSGLRENPRVIVIWFEQNEQLTIHFKGRVEIKEDEETKKRFWHKRWKEIWPGGYEDSGYLLLRFVPESMSYFDEEQLKTLQVEA